VIIKTAGFALRYDLRFRGKHLRVDLVTIEDYYQLFFIAFLDFASTNLLVSLHKS